jgi:alpha-beta hydrolase superfamily lysophospholipase
MNTIIKRLVLLFAAIAILLGGSAAVGAMLGSGILHPYRKPVTADNIAIADRAFAEVHATRADFEVAASDGAKLRGWKVRAENPNGDWVVIYHGVGDNRCGQIGYAQFLLAHGYGAVIMDARAQGESGGEIATYGWNERNDSKVIDDALLASESVRHLFYFGESMGAALALQSAAVDPHIAGVVAEDPFANLREVTYDYAGLQFSPLLGKTLFRPAAIVALSEAEKEGGFKASDVSPERAVAARAFPIFLICGTLDRKIPCRHARRIFRRAIGPKELWVVRGAGHSNAYGVQHQEFENRVLGFLDGAAKKSEASSAKAAPQNSAAPN